MITKRAKASPEERRLEAVRKLLKEEGVKAGLSLPRLVVPKRVIPEESVRRLGFYPVIVAAPEAGQDRVTSYRHPDQHHMHSHGDRWTIHRDELPVPSSEMKAAKTLGGKVRAVARGVPHVVIEGGRGWGEWVSQAVKGKKMAEEVEREMSENTKRKLKRLEKTAELRSVEKAIETKSVDSYRQLKKTLRAGDILATAPDHRHLSVFYSKLFKPVSRLSQSTDYGHAAYYAGNGRVIHGNNSQGFHETSLKELADKNSIIAVRLKKPKKEEIDKATAYAETTIGRKFDVPTVLRAATPFRGERQRKLVDAERLICSGMIANAYAKRRFSDKDRLITRPSDILESDEVVPVAARVLKVHQKGTP